MENEIRTSPLIGYLFVIIGVPSTGALLYLSMDQADLLVPACFFALGAVTGIKLLIRPIMLVRIKDGKLELFNGSLFGNKPEVIVRLEDSEFFEIRRVDIGDGNSWFLMLHVTKPQELSEVAKSRFRAYEKYGILTDKSDRRITWDLGDPEGGIKKAEQRLRDLTRPFVRSTDSSS